MAPESPDAPLLPLWFVCLVIAGAFAVAGHIDAYEALRQEAARCMADPVQPASTAPEDQGDPSPAASARPIPASPLPPPLPGCPEATL